VYVAEASLPDSALPPIVQGDVYERRIATIAERAKELIGQSAGPPTPTIAGQRSLSQLTVEQFERLLTGALALAAAGAKEDRAPATYQAVAVAAKNVAGSVLTGFQSAGTAASAAKEDWHNKILWVDDRPANNAFERESMQAMGLEFTLALSTDEALDILRSQHFAVIISDMGREDGPQEGDVLLHAVRERGLQTPFFIYAGSRAPEHQREAIARGAQGSTNRARELIDLVARALPSQ
jgi:CheY-like chemotaxis protein